MHYPDSDSKRHFMANFPVRAKNSIIRADAASTFIEALSRLNSKEVVG